MNKKISFAQVIVLLVIFVLMSVNADILFRMGQELQNEKTEFSESQTPAEIQITTISVTNCAECAGVSALAASLSGQTKLKITEKKTIESDSDDGKKFIETYKPEKLPTLLLQGEVEKALKNIPSLASQGKKTSDGNFLLTEIPAPYRDVLTGEVKGKVTAIYLTDNTCEECYDVSAHKKALTQLSIKPIEEKTLDRSETEAKSLITQYAIQSLPTIILQGDLAAYKNFQSVWKSVGTAESDGSYVFRSGQSLMGAYKDLTTGEIVEPKKETNSNTNTSANNNTNS